MIYADFLLPTVQAYHRNLQSILPPEIAAHLLPLPKFNGGGLLSKSVTLPLSVVSSESSTLPLPPSQSSQSSIRKLPQLASASGEDGMMSLLTGENSSIKSSASLPSLPAAGYNPGDAPCLSDLTYPDQYELGSGRSQVREQLLEKVAKSITQSSVKYGSAGSMPLAPVQSHLAVRNSTHKNNKR